jgi:hypothetical protein
VKVSQEAPKAEMSTRGIVIAICLAIVTGGVGYGAGILQDYRTGEIEFVHQQIEKLYGPLFALSIASKRSADELFLKLRPGKRRMFDETDPPNATQVETWRRWIKEVFHPMNVRMERAITENAQLIEGGHIYPVFTDLILHVESYKATIAKWKDTDAKENPHFLEGPENAALIPFPVGFDDCVKQRFEAMRAKAERLKTSVISFPEKYDDSSFPANCR